MSFFQSGEKDMGPEVPESEEDTTPLNRQSKRFEKAEEPLSEGKSMRRQGRVYRLQPAVKQYAWGIRGGDSRVARYGLEAGTLRNIDQSAPYAELSLAARTRLFEVTSL